MRSALSKRVVQRFVKRLNELVPGSDEESSVKLPKGFRCFNVPLRNDASTFLVLVIAPKDNEFTLEVAWSIHSRFPFSLSAIYSPIDPENGTVKDAPINGELAFRLPLLYPPYADIWWSVDEMPSHDMTIDEILADDPLATPTKLGAEELDRADAAVDTAISAVKSFAVPYLSTLHEKYPATFKNAEG